MDDTKAKLAKLLHDCATSENGNAIITRLLGTIDDRAAATVLADCEGLMNYRNYISEAEAKRATAKLENFDGTHGPHWREPSRLFEMVAGEGVEPDTAPDFNRWALYVVANMIWADDWGVLREFVAADQEGRMIALLSRCRLTQSGKDFAILEAMSE